MTMIVSPRYKAKIKLNAKPSELTNITQTKPHGLSSVGGKQRELMKKELKNTIAAVSANTIRRNRIRYNEAICFELDEDGYSLTADYIRKLIDLNEEIRNSHGPDTWMWIQPQLKNSNDQLDILSQGLVEAENANRQGKKISETESILKLAIHFMNMPEAWWWLAEQLFSEAIQISKSLKSDGGRLFAVVRYIFGRFLFLQLKDHKAALPHLKFIRDRSSGTSWKATELDIPQDLIFNESCGLLAEVLLTFSEEYREENLAKALHHCKLALKRAKESNKPEVIGKVYLQLGLFNLEVNEPTAALHNFEQYVIVSKDNNNYPGICDGFIHVALAYTKLGRATEAEQHLMDEIKIAYENNLRYYEAQGHRYAGEFYLYQNLPDNSSEHFTEAFRIFNFTGTHTEQDEMRCFMGVAKGNALMNNYTKLIVCCGRHDKKMRHLAKLCHWKGHRENFWSNIHEGDLWNKSILHGSYQSVKSITHIEDIVESIIETALRFAIDDFYILNAWKLPATEEARYEEEGAFLHES